MNQTSYNISVIIPLFSVDSAFSCLLDDLKNQNAIDLDILIVASSETYKKAKPCCEEKGITHTHIESPTYRDFARGMNQAIRAARGEYISIIPERAIIPSDFYKELFTCAKDNRCAVVKARSYTLFPDGHICRSDSSKAISQGIQREEPLSSLYIRDIHTGLFSSKLLREKNVQIEQVGSLTNIYENCLTQILTDLPVASFAMAQKAVCGVRAADGVDPAPELYREVPACTGNKQPVHVCVITDNGYAIPTIVMLTSMKHNKKSDTHYVVHVIMHAIDSIWLDAMMELESSDFEIKYYEKNAKKFIDANLAQKKHIPPFGLIRFDVCDILSNLERVLYLDGDHIIRTDLSDLYNIELGDNYIAAVRDYPGETVRKLHVEMEAQYYINSGVMVMNLKLMRADKLADALLDAKIHSWPTWRLQDQDVFNYVCRNRAISLHLRYNNLLPLYMRLYKLKDLNRFFGTTYNSFQEMMQDVAILHLGGLNGRRPWQVDNGFCGELWQRYFNISPIRDYDLARGLYISPAIESGLVSMIEKEITSGKLYKYVGEKQAFLEKMLSTVANYKKHKMRYLRYSILSKVTFGKTRKRYKEKKRTIKELLSHIK